MKWILLAVYLGLFTYFAGKGHYEKGKSHVTHIIIGYGENMKGFNLSARATAHLEAFILGFIAIAVVELICALTHIVLF